MVRSRNREDEPLSTEPEAVFAVVAHWHDASAPARAACLQRCVDGLLALQVDDVVVTVLTNAPEAVAPSIDARVVVARWRPRLWHRSGHYLPWGHVPLLRDAAQSGRFSHLLYLEDDMGFTDQHLRHWCRYRGPLAPLGLVPGFARFEWHEGERYLVDVVTPLDPTVRRLALPSDHPGLCREVVNLENPYQGLYVLDRPLAAAYFSQPRSALRSRAMPVALGVRERAASGPLFDDVPAGLVSRNVVPVLEEGGRPRLDPDCLVEHMAGTYTADPTSAFGSLKVDDVFAGG